MVPKLIAFGVRLLLIKAVATGDAVCVRVG
ncbi:hypothetical protein FHR84_001940 [Actinopolyspora biskrensis]|uniref:Uncharacterized protein n=1 Tax=Actinopolyspora biskrensis TaxID=1470178 RepID=A0A852Z031_9ACTN|nr:hypothetical protein [Actinopolyspora biskrensis]